MKVAGQNNNRFHFSLHGVKRVFVLLVLFVYLIIPFKQQFLDVMHLTSHIAMHDVPHHSHDHATENANHHHGFIETFTQAVNGYENTTAIPVELKNFQFQTPLPSDIFHTSNYTPSIIKKSILFLFIPLFTGPLFEVPLPPP